jgi:hypothetical protein
MYLNRIQRRILWAAVVLFVAVGLFPPWHRGPRNEGYAPIFSPPSTATIDFGRLLVQWVMLIVVAAATVFLTKGAKEASRFRVPALLAIPRCAFALATRHWQKVAAGLCLALAIGLCAICLISLFRPDKYEAIELRKGMPDAEIISQLGKPDVSEYPSFWLGKVAEEWGLNQQICLNEIRKDEAATASPLVTGINQSTWKVMRYAPIGQTRNRRPR